MYGVVRPLLRILFFRAAWRSDAVKTGSLRKFERDSLSGRDLLDTAQSQRSDQVAVKGKEGWKKDQ